MTFILFYFFRESGKSVVVLKNRGEYFSKGTDVYLNFRALKNNTWTDFNISQINIATRPNTYK